MTPEDGGGGGVGVGIGGGGGSTASSSPVARVVDGGGGSGRRKPSWRERENNKRRERRRRAIAAKIYTGLRAQGNYILPKHCDNNEVLKALCSEAGWIVEPDGTTYRKGSKPSQMETGGTSTNITPSSSRNPSPPSSYFASPIASYQASPLSSVCPSPTRQNANTDHRQSHPFAFLQNTLPPNLPPLRISNSAPITPPFSSPTSRRPPKPVFNFDYLERESMFGLNFPFVAASAPTSPTRGQRFAPATIPECHEYEDTSTNWMNFRNYPSNMVPISPTLNLTKPVVSDTVVADTLVDAKGKGLMEFDSVKAWEGERIHEVGPDDLELTLGNSYSRV